LTDLNVIAHVFRDYAIQLCDPLCAIFNASIQQSSLLVCMEKFNVISLPKNIHLHQCSLT